MSDLSRPLNTDTQIRQFFDAIDFFGYFSDMNNQKYAFPGMNNVNAMVGKAISLIKEANNGLEKVLKYNTYDSSKNRSIPYKRLRERKKLHQVIIQELKETIRPLNDENICLGTGGMLPRTKKVDCDKKAFILIGLPAAGKSGVASKISDYFNAVLLDSDFVKRKIPEYAVSNGASLVHKESKVINDIIKTEAIEEGVNIVFPIIGSDYDGVLDIVYGLQRFGYHISLVLVELDRVKSTQRAFSRFMNTGRYIPLSMILDVYSNNPSLVFYKILANQELKDMPMVLIDSDVPLGQRQKIVIERNFQEIHNII